MSGLRASGFVSRFLATLYGSFRKLGVPLKGSFKGIYTGFYKGFRVSGFRKLRVPLKGSFKGVTIRVSRKGLGLRVSEN